MLTKKINETRIYDNLTQTEKAILMFKELGNKNTNVFDKLLNSGEAESWTVRNHEARMMLDSLGLLSLFWGVEYWKNQTRLGAGYSLVHSKDRKAISESHKVLKECLLKNEALLIFLEQLEDDYGLSKETVLVLAGIDQDAIPIGEGIAVIDEGEEIETLVNTLYINYSSFLPEEIKG